MEHLKAFLERSKIRPSEFADTIGTSRGYLHDILNDRRRPGLKTAVAIERATEGAVPAATWSPAQASDTAA